MIYQHNTGNWKWRALAKRRGYVVRLYRPTTLAIPAIMNSELADMQARRRAAQIALEPQYTNRPDPAWIGAASPVAHDGAMAVGALA